MKYFGQYLVSKGIISEELLTDALIEQLSDLPSVVGIVRKKNLLSSSQLLAVFACQTEKQLEFKQACADLGIWNNEINDTVKKELEGLRVPLGQILIKKGATDLQTITKALDEFLSRVEAPAVDSKVPTAPAPKTKSEAPVVVEASAPQPTPISTGATDSQIDVVLLDEFVSFLTDERLQNFRSLFVELDGSNGPLSSESLNEHLKQLFTGFRSLRGLLKFVHLEKTGALVSRIEMLTFRAIEQSARGDAHLVSTLSELGKIGVELLAALKVILVQHRSEEPWLKHPDIGPRVEALFQNLKKVFDQEKIQGDA